MGDRQPNAIVEAVLTANADIIGFQETSRDLERTLRMRLSKTHPYFHSAGYKGEYGAERFAFASRRELIDLSYTPPNGGLFGFYSATAIIDGTPTRILNVHLKPLLLPKNARIRDAMRALSETETVHTQEIATVSDTIDPDQPTIVLGDFNSISSFVAPQRLIQLGLIDSQASFREDADSEATWSWPTRPLPLSLRIDYIFHSRHFRTQDAAVIAQGGSDHRLYVVELVKASDAAGKPGG